ncbi:MAG: 4-hydroxythreonine-4-phosphate dehydrogenase PdxA [Proteobacteria bacterium]|nr:4-hydroxythreonine-4-phosphate dehydrogenase PdxA [Pseudomonadota bacterium]
MRDRAAAQVSRIVITSGEPAGIGPDICASLAQSDWDCELIVAGDESVLGQAATALGLPLSLRRFDPGAARVAHRAGTLCVLPVATVAPVQPGRLDPRNAPYVLQMLNLACDGCRDGTFDAMVTAPVQKSVIMDSKVEFTGHTEYLAQRCGARLPVMMLVGEDLRVALVTTHLPLSEVPRAITAQRLEDTIRIVHADLQRLFRLANPRLLLLGLNPHAGESGHLGREEVEIIEPLVERLKREGICITGPVPADSAFTQDQRRGADVIIAMYHDQGLPVLKYAAFDTAVNVTLGLSIVRTSVDHGTALALARSGKASDGSLRSALSLAIVLAR